jgi:hypothetical protein
MPLLLPVATGHSIAEEPANEKGAVSATGVSRASECRALEARAGR